METIKIIELCFKIIIGVVGWMLFSYQFLNAIPKITGQVLFFMRATYKANFGNNVNEITGYMLYPLLTNKGKRPILIINYELEIDVGNGYEKTRMVHGLDNSMNHSFENMIIPDFVNQLIYKKKSFIKYGQPLHGFLVFGKEDVSYAKKEVFKYKLICIDVFNKKHVIERSTKKLIPFDTFLNFSGSRFKNSFPK